jgi:hypothetical protein
MAAPGEGEAGGGDGGVGPARVGPPHFGFGFGIGIGSLFGPSVAFRPRLWREPSAEPTTVQCS